MLHLISALVHIRIETSLIQMLSIYKNEENIYQNQIIHSFFNHKKKLATENFKNFAYINENQV